MSERLDYFSTSPKAMNILLEQEQYLARQCDSGESISKSLLELVKLRVSQMNQCAYCIDMHSKDAVHYGENPQRLYALSAWRYAPFYTEVERCALEWAECLTAGNGVEDQRYQNALAVLGEVCLVDLTIAVNAINSWNRIAKAFAPDVGDYSPR